MATTFEHIASIAVGATALILGDQGGALHAAGAGASLVAGAVERGERERVVAALADKHPGAADDPDIAAVGAIFAAEGPALLLDPSALRACLASPEGYAACASARLLDALGLTRRHGFSPAAVAAAQGLAEAALEAAQANEAYYRALSLNALLTLAQTVARLQADGQAPRRLLENLAMRFGHDNPDALAAKLEAYLKDAAKQYAGMKARREELAAAEARLANILGAVDGAMAAGDFAEADALLAQAEEMHVQERLAEPARAFAALRGQRFDAALLAGDEGAALDHLKAAAGALDAVDPAEAGRRLYDGGGALYDRGLRYGGPGLAAAAQAFAACQTRWTRAADPDRWGWAENVRALALGHQAARTEGAAGAELLGQAVDAYHAALQVRTRDAYPVDWAMTQHNLAIALRNQAARTEKAAGAELLRQAVDACRAALQVYTRAAHPVDWARTQNNLANALSDQAARTEGAAGAELLGQAVDACRAALQVRTRAAHPVAWAATQNNLAAVLSHQAWRTEGAGAELLRQAVDAYRASLEVCTRVAHPVDWAETTHNTGLALEALGDWGDDLLGNWAAAREAFEAALEVFDPEHMAVNHAKAARARDLVVAKLAGLGGG